MKCHAAVYGLSAVLIVGALGLWYLTGSEGYTRWPNSRLEQADAPAPPGQEDLLSEAGFDSNATGSTPPSIESRFAFGLLPGGIDLKHVPSVAATLGVSVLFSGVTMIHGTRKRAQAKRESLHKGEVQ